jgi:primosomal protein N' (replication factor Y)
MRASVLPAQHGLGALDYLLPDGTPAGTVVAAPLGPRRIHGVVWDEGAFPPADLTDDRLRPATPLAHPGPLPAPLRALILWVADYYVAAPGAVLAMALPSAAFAPPPRPQPHYRLAPGLDAAALRPPARRALVERLQALGSNDPAPLAALAAAAGVTPARLRPLVKAGILVEAEPAAPAPFRAAAPQLGPDQQRAAEALAAAVAAGGFQPFLLDGVTGSGKTETYFEAVAEALRGDGQVLVLLPEIALTDAWLARFAARFGFRPTVWHSSLTPAARRDAFAAIADGRARVVLGARSALFLPLRALRLIIVDEAHDSAYKQEEGVPYHGRDVAVMRARFEGVPVVLATATPALETVEQVARGTYRLLHLGERHGGALLPVIRLVDLTRTPPPRGRWIAPPLAAAVALRLAAGEQSLLFLNRRGYAPLTLCRACGERIQCPNCTAWLVEHRSSGRLQCHHCGHSVPTPAACPACGAADSLAACGPGVERLAEEVAVLWPAARTLVVTSDTLRTHEDAARLAAAVAASEVDILIGTQVLTKGHDFRHLTLVGVIDADLGLAGGDLRAAERSFQQIQQVAGRAGRGTLPGEVFIQTHQPQAPVMRALAAGDRDGFLAAERAARMAATMPPFGRLCALILSSPDAAAAAAAARALAMAAPAVSGIDVWGPAPAPLAMLRGRHRQRLLVHAGRHVRLQDYVRGWLAAVRLPGSVRLLVDMDPQSFV